MIQNIPFSPGELQRGESKYQQKGNLVVTTWRNRNGHVENVTCPLSIQLYNSYMGGVDRADQLCGYYHVRMKSHKFYQFVLFELTRVHSLYFIFFPSPQYIHLLVYLGLLHVNVFTLLKYFQPSTGSTIRQNLIKSFRLELAQGRIGNYNSRQRYALPPALHDAAHKFTSAPAKRRRNECGTPDGTAPTLEGHFPIKGSTGHCCYCWNVK